MSLKDLGAYFQLGEKLKDARKTSGQSQKEFAAMLGIPASTYSNYENGNRIPPAAILQKVADVLKQPVHVLFSLDAPPSPLPVFHDWLESVGYDVVLYEDEEQQSINIRDRATRELYRLTDQELDMLQEKVAAFTRFQMAEFINAQKSAKKGGKGNAAKE